MKRDERYDYVNYLYNKGQLKSFYDLFKKLPKSVLAKDMGIQMRRFRELLNEPQKFTISEIFIIASFFKIERWEMVRLVGRQRHLNEKDKNKVKE